MAKLNLLLLTLGALVAYVTSRANEADSTRPVCPKNEVYSYCMNGGCMGPRTCAQYIERGNYTVCIDLIEGACRRGCICKDDWVRRTDNNKCVPRNKCPKVCSGEYEVYDDCPVTCPPDTCAAAAIGQDYHCPIQPAVCKPGCRCQDGYCRDDEYNCRPKKDSQMCTGKNEVWDDCPKTCPPDTCAAIGKKYHCPIQPAVCRPACRCQDGYCRDDDNICRPKGDCHK